MARKTLLEIPIPIGRAIALELARQGVAVAVNDVDDRAAAAVCEEITRTDERALPLCCDVAESGAVKRGVSRLSETWAAPEILVNNAGFRQYAPFEEISEDQWDRMLAVHLKGAFNPSCPA